MLRGMIRAALCVLLATAALSAQRPILPRPPAPDLVLFNGKVITVDRGFTVHQAVAIIGDRIMAVGNDDQMRTVAGTATRMIDLEGRSVIPGLMDNHLHGAGGGPGIDLSRARSLADVEAALGARITASKPGDVIVSNSDWHEAQLKEQRLPLRDDLDRVAPQNPVVLVRGGHEYIVNSAALTRWDITEKTPQPAGGRITRYADGRLNGELVDTAKSLVRLPPPAPRTPQQQLDDRIADYKKLNEAGLTGIRHPGISIAEYRMLQEMQKRGQLTIRVNALLRPAIGAAGVDPALAASGIRQNEGDELLRIGGIKLAVDGGFEGGLMRDLYEQPWDENGTFRGLQTIDTERYVAAVRELNRQDWRVATHAVGDAAIDLVLNAYETRQRRTVDRRSPLVDRARLHRAAGSSAADEGARRCHLGAESPLPCGSEPGEILGRRPRRHHDAGEDVSRCPVAGVVGNRRAGRALSSTVDAVSLHHARHDHRRRARIRSEGGAATGAAHGDDQQRVAQHGRTDEGIDRAWQAR